MKYIRTKDGIYKEDDYLFNPRIKIEKEYCLKTADTIEELCDEFVIIFPDGTWETYKMFGVLEDCLKMDYYKGCRYYGAIYTDKGLIYKARMKGVLPNGKIDWELL